MVPKILRDCSLEISLWDYERSTGSYFLGGVRLNVGSGLYHGKQCDWMDANEKERDMWSEMLKNPGVTIGDMLPLRDR